jgi:hypothetical protein
MRDGVNKRERVEMIAHLAELDQTIEDDMANLKFALEMSRLVPIITERLERLEEARRLYLSALKHLLGESLGEDEPGHSR